ncbi:MAG: hypothetical protein J1F68_00090 [Clostridiales bacterium]|nr:hypothetical protein [Clostridiales bacterium]
MKKIVEKVVLVALICITFVFALTTILYVTNVIPQDEVSNNSVAVILLSVLAAIYVGLATYLVYVNFSERINVKRILLFYDAESATSASSRVVDNIVKGCSKQVNKVKVRRTALRVDDKQGLVATVHVEVAAEDVTHAIPELRALLVQNFQDTLGLKFNAINFEIDKLNSKFVPDTGTDPVEAPAKAETQAITETVEAPTAVEEQQAVEEPVTVEPTETTETIETIEAKPIETPLSELFRTLEALETETKNPTTDEADIEKKAE